jgi:hypothetical protein
MPSGSDIPVHTARSLMEWQMHRKTPSIFSFKLDTYIEKARNEAVVQAVQANATHLMFIDSDMYFPPDGVDRLLAHKKDIVGGLYFGRMHPKPMAFRIKDNQSVSVDPRIEHGVVEVDFIGTGFMLIDMKVFEKLDPPFFSFSYHPEDIGLPKTGDMFAPKGEDVFFCMYAKKNGFKVFCDTDLKLGHVGQRVYGERDFLLYKENPEHYEKLPF